MKSYGELDVIYKLDEVEKAVLNIAEEMSKEVQKIKYGSLYYKAKRVLNYSKIEISNAINKLYLKKYIVVGSRLTKDQILQNQTRKRVYEYIVAHIGAHIREIRDNLSITPHILNWHLNMLENFNYTFRIKFLKYVTFFPSTFDRTAAVPFLALKNENSFRIFKKCLENPLVDFESLRAGLNLQPNVIFYHLNNLIKFDVIFAHKINQTVVYGIKLEKITPIKTFYDLSDEEIENAIRLQNIMTEKSSTNKNNRIYLI
ncbi:MAG: hypothetical protein HWN65_19480 [Candidatus Helarchaeota archaeon]|nr:hypothetical protein [Candidatus Helarchaeota archaeon]